MATSQSITWARQYEYHYQEMKNSTNQVATWLKRNYEENHRRLPQRNPEYPLDVGQYIHCATFLRDLRSPGIEFPQEFTAYLHYAIWARLHRVEIEYPQRHNWNKRQKRKFKSHVHFLLVLMKVHDILLQRSNQDPLRYCRDCADHGPRQLASANFPWRPTGRFHLRLTVSVSVARGLAARFFRARQS
ncbi:uncharacterized protein BO66DRAFT_82714 [Aspergillus aculeatinus CBS 121060]|uniref:Uncharacterized protein n=1 Tax=Aspergillus aculeatinus CBS 121060 TaxID=1448322 RepID=A0ACD1H9Y1_9EURO|nr:hypothetical protein BO66DRAFT_82714 [Aspergillus aculeatinus CBS 121060]RAH70565.1 hypothetical protein BO66DRAFT_82714 [Aspergillus aculeatinus CBS 121060]